MDIFIQEGEEYKVKNIGYKDKIIFNCLMCGKRTSIVNKYKFKWLYCKRCGIVRTSKIKYGTNNPAQAKASIEKQKLTKASKSEEEKSKTKEKYKKSMLEKYGVDNPAKSKSIQKKIQATNKQKYGGTGFASKELHLKSEKTSYKKYNKSLYDISIEGHNKKCYEKYGVKYYMQVKFIQEKAEKTNLLKYHQKHPGKCTYIYNNLRFDSSWELYYYLYLKNYNMKFIYHPNISFKYTYNDKDYEYFPDFKVNDRYIELKGPQFFKEDGTMCNPFNNKQDKLYEAKHQCMIRNNVEIITDISLYKNFVENNYSKDYIKNFKVKK